MKRLLLLIPLMCELMVVVVQAANDDVVGHIYSTDIRAYINDIEVPSYNIGGRTVIIVEDILRDRRYYEDLQILNIGSFHPACIAKRKSETSDITGQILGDVYKTDIKTYVYDVELQAYNIGGKTAVALEDLGDDRSFSEIGGRYFWDEDSRTIKLEMLYGNYDREAMFGKRADIELTVNKNMPTVEAIFTSNKYSVGANIRYSDDFKNLTMEKQPVLLPITTRINDREEILGYYFGHSFIDVTTEYETTEHGRRIEGGLTYHVMHKYYNVFCYFYDDVLNEGLQTVAAAELTAADEVVMEYIIYHVCSVVDSFDTDEYTFAYLTQGTPHGANVHLLLIQPDGTYHDYWEDFKSVSLHGTKWFDNVTIDKENEKCYFRYDVDYMIDLKTGAMSKLQ